MKRSEKKLDEQNAKIIELQFKIPIQDNALQRLEIKFTMSNIIVICVYVSMVFNTMKMMIIVSQIKLNSDVIKTVSNLI